MISKDRTHYTGLQDIMQIKELQLTTDMLNMEGLNSEEKVKKMKDNALYAVSDRAKEIRRLQRKNLEERFVLIERASNDIELQLKIRQACKLNPLYWFNMRAWTYNPRLTYPYNHLPFITYPFQDDFIHDLIKAIEEGNDLRVEKSRDMGFSWVVLGVYLRGFLFHDRTTLIGSYKENYVHMVGDMDSSFERIIYMLERTPKRMKPSDLNVKFMSISSKEGGAKEIGGDAGSAFGTGGRRKSIFADEFALRQNDKTALRKTKDVTNCRIFGGTPEGTTNVYGKVMTAHKDYKHMLVKKIRLLWDQHPLKTKVRYDLQKATRTKVDLAKEIDVSYQDSVTGAVYPNFLSMCNFGEHKYNPRLPLYRSWDFGLDMNAVIYRQKDFKTNLLYIVKSVSRKDRDIRKMAGLILSDPFILYKTEGNDYEGEHFEYTLEDQEFMKEVKNRGRGSGDYGDPYNSDNRSVVDKKNTISSLLSQCGIELQTSRSNKVEGRIRTATLALGRIHIDSDQTDVITSLTQSKYPQIRETSQSTMDNRKPVHDDNSHFRTSFEYFLDLEPENDMVMVGTSVDYSSLI